MKVHCVRIGRSGICQHGMLLFVVLYLEVHSGLERHMVRKFLLQFGFHAHPYPFSVESALSLRGSRASSPSTVGIFHFDVGLRRLFWNWIPWFDFICRFPTSGFRPVEVFGRVITPSLDLKRIVSLWDCFSYSSLVACIRVRLAPLSSQCLLGRVLSEVTLRLPLGLGNSDSGFHRFKLAVELDVELWRNMPGLDI